MLIQAPESQEVNRESDDSRFVHGQSVMSLMLQKHGVKDDISDDEEEDDGS